MGKQQRTQPRIFGNTDRAASAREAQLQNPNLKEQFQSIKQEFESRQIKMSKENLKIFEGAYEALSGLTEITTESLALLLPKDQYQAMNNVLQYGKKLGQQFMNPQNFVMFAMVLSLAMLPTANADLVVDWRNANIPENPEGDMSKETCIAGLTNLRYDKLGELIIIGPLGFLPDLALAAYVQRVQGPLVEIAGEYFGRSGDEFRKFATAAVIELYGRCSDIFKQDQQSQPLTEDQIAKLELLVNSVEVIDPQGSEYKPFREAALQAVKAMSNYALGNLEDVALGVNRLLELSNQYPIYGEVVPQCQENLRNVLSNLESLPEVVSKPQPEKEQQDSIKGNLGYVAVAIIAAAAAAGVGLSYYNNRQGARDGGDLESPTGDVQTTEMRPLLSRQTEHDPQIS